MTTRFASGVLPNGKKLGFGLGSICRTGKSMTWRNCREAVRCLMADLDETPQAQRQTGRTRSRSSITQAHAEPAAWSGVSRAAGRHRPQAMLWPGPTTLTQQTVNLDHAEGVKPNCANEFSHRLGSSNTKRDRCGKATDPAGLPELQMPVPGGQVRPQHGFSVRMHAICDSWVGVDGVKLEGSSVMSDVSKMDPVDGATDGAHPT